jgi:hypothetical protein
MKVPKEAPAAPAAAQVMTSINEMCSILAKQLIKADEYTDCAIVYKVTFDQLRSLYDLGRAALTSAPAEPPKGFMLVPVEPTDAMTWAGQRARYPNTNSITAIYKAMISTAPVPPAQTPQAAGHAFRKRKHLTKPEK